MAGTPNQAEIDRLLSRLRDWAGYDPVPHARTPDKLCGMRRLLERVGHPEQSLRIVHIAGTNGKGMTAAMTDRLLTDAGLRVARYSSPHLLNIRERFLLADTPPDDATLAAAGHRVLDEADALRSGMRLAYFDVLTAIALFVFANDSPDWVVLETGLGGRADATNVTPKELAIITRIGWDHMDVLGDTLEHIAAEKLGIARKGIPTVVSQQSPTLGPWIADRLQALGSPVHWSDAYACTATGAPGEGVTVSEPGGTAIRVSVPEAMITPPRLQSAASALAAAAVLLGEVGAEALARRARVALETPVPARLDLRHEVGLKGRAGAIWAQVVLDGGHNAGAVEALNAQLTRWGIGAYTLIFGIQEDKLVEPVQPAIHRLLAGAHQVIALPPQGPRAPSSESLAGWIVDLAGDLERPPAVMACTTAEDALNCAAEVPQHPLVVAGSFWMLGGIVALLAESTGAPLVS